MELASLEISPYNPHKKKTLIKIKTITLNILISLFLYVSFKIIIKYFNIKNAVFRRRRASPGSRRRRTSYVPILNSTSFGRKRTVGVA